MSQQFCGMSKLQNCPGKRNKIFSYKHKPLRQSTATDTIHEMSELHQTFLQKFLEVIQQIAVYIFIG